MKLHILNVFYLSNGRTSFSFLSNDLPNFVEKGWFYLIVDGKQVKKIWIDGEDFIKYLGERTYRSLSTDDPSIYKKLSFNEGSWELISVSGREKLKKSD